MKRATLPLTAAMGLLLSACLAPVPQELIDARTAYERASNSQTRVLAPDELMTARRALRRAESEYQRAPTSQPARDLAYIAERRVQIAESRARLKIAQQDRAGAEQQLVARRAQAASEQREQLTRAQQQLDDQRQQLQARQQELDEARKQQAQAEADRRDALQQLRQIANVKEEQRGTVITLPSGLLFAPGRSDLSPDAARALEEVAQALQTAPEHHVVVEGHTDTKGSEDANYELSVLRANAVKDFLSSHGVDRGRVEAVGFGETRPIASNQSAEGRATNRRVEIVVQRGVGGSEAPLQH